MDSFSDERKTPGLFNHAWRSTTLYIVCIFTGIMLRLQTFFCINRWKKGEHVQIWLVWVTSDNINVIVCKEENGKTVSARCSLITVAAINMVTIYLCKEKFLNTIYFKIRCEFFTLVFKERTKQLCREKTYEWSIR